MSDTDAQTQQSGADYINGGATVWCKDGHDPKIVDQDRGVGVCPECGAEYRISLEVEPLDR